MSDILNKSIVLVLHRNWQAINVRTPQDGSLDHVVPRSRGGHETRENLVW